MKSNVLENEIWGHHHRSIHVFCASFCSSVSQSPWQMISLISVVDSSYLQTWRRQIRPVCCEQIWIVSSTWYDAAPLPIPFGQPKFVLFPSLLILRLVKLTSLDRTVFQPMETEILNGLHIWLTSFLSYTSFINETTMRVNFQEGGCG